MREYCDSDDLQRTGLLRFTVAIPAYYRNGTLQSRDSYQLLYVDVALLEGEGGEKYEQQAGELHTAGTRPIYPVLNSRTV